MFNKTKKKVDTSKMAYSVWELQKMDGEPVYMVPHMGAEHGATPCWGFVVSGVGVIGRHFSGKFINYGVDWLAYPMKQGVQA